MEMGKMKTTRQCMLTGMLVLMVALAMVAPASADDSWRGQPLETKLHGTVNGGVDVLFADTWTATGSVTDWSKQEVDAQFTLEVNPQNNPVKFARLYVVPYVGNMTADYTGNLTVTVDSTKVVDSQPLDLSYNRTVGATYNTSVSSPLLDLSRVTSDYVAVIDVTNLVAAKTTTDLDVNVITHNLTGNFDGRIKEVKLVYGWNVTSGGADTKYWVNEGHDPITKNIGTYTDNKTWFNGTTDPEAFTAELWVDYLASASGTYTWNGNAITPTVTQGTYAGLGYLTWAEGQPPYVLEDNALTYNRVGSWYKLITAVFTLE
jgi:hypothetical protein